jgi:uncharacterized protein (TIGR00296 family)
MFSITEGSQAVEYARKIVESFTKHDPIPQTQSTPFFNTKLGVFVTLHTYPDHSLRGCIGIPEPVMTLQKAIIEAATSVTHDPRFPPLSKHELDKIIVEVTILTKPKLIEYNKPQELVKKITIGTDGLIITCKGRSGLLLPQVPVEQNWDVEDFLTHLCFKAGLAPDAWFEKEVRIYKFQGQIFTEAKPRGTIKENTLNEL